MSSSRGLGDTDPGSFYKNILGIPGLLPLGGPGTCPALSSIHFPGHGVSFHDSRVFYGEFASGSASREGPLYFVPLDRSLSGDFTTLLASPKTPLHGDCQFFSILLDVDGLGSFAARGYRGHLPIPGYVYILTAQDYRKKQKSDQRYQGTNFFHFSLHFF
jgi:hypothetical protein